MLLEYWTAHYAEAAKNGQNYEAEDDEFDLQKLLAEAGDGDDAWEDAPDLSR